MEEAAIIATRGCESTHQVWVLCGDALERLDKDEDVVDADGEDEEGQDLEDDHGAGDAQVAEEARRRHDREQHDGQSGDGEGNLEGRQVLNMYSPEIKFANT